MREPGPDRPAAYQGSGWKPRENTLASDVEAGELWRRAGVRAEWHELKDVLLFIPDPDTPPPCEANAVQHLDAIHFPLLSTQMEAAATAFERLGVRVHKIVPLSSGPFYNLVFARDLLFMTLEGAVVSRMASQVRAGEERHAAHALAEMGVPILRTISGRGTFEGADALWAREDLVLVGVGNRTNRDGFDQLAACLSPMGVRCEAIALPDRVQHLLGCFQIVDKDLAVVRGSILPDASRSLIEGLGFDLLFLEESEEVARHQAMNFVVLGPRRIAMTAGCPYAAAIYRDAGIEVAHEFDIQELLKGAGGPACATAVIYRKPP
jgi:N-dimethylarginine dimethylaminohydrolase